MKHKKLIIAGLVLSFVSSVLWYARSSINSKRDLALKLQMEQSTGHTVEVEKVISAPMTRRVTAVGTLKANQQVVIKPAEAAHISQILFKEGERVEEGAPLIILENSVQKAEYESAKTTMNVQKANYVRAEELLKRGAGTPAQRDKALLEFRHAEAQVNAAKVKMEKTIIRAPFGGYISFKDAAVGPGAWVQHGQDLVTLVDTDPMKVEFQIPEAYLNDFQIGQTVEVFIDGQGAKSAKATIEAIDAKVNPLTHSIMVRAIIFENEPHFKPGQFANIKMEVGKSQDITQINESAIETNGDQSFVYRIIEEKALRTRVIPGIRDGKNVEIIDGLTPGDMVVTAGQVKLRDGDRVRIVNKGDLEEKSNSNSLEKMTKPLAQMMLGPKSIMLQPTLMKLAKKKDKTIPAPSLEGEKNPSDKAEDKNTNKQGEEAPKETSLKEPKESLEKKDTAEAAPEASLSSMEEPTSSDSPSGKVPGKEKNASEITPMASTPEVMALATLGSNPENK